MSFLYFVLLQAVVCSLLCLRILILLKSVPFQWGSETVAPAVPVQPAAFGSAAPEVAEWGAEATAPSGKIEWGAEPTESKGQESWGGGAGAEWS